MKKFFIVFTTVAALIPALVYAGNYGRPLSKSAINLSKIPWKIMYESYSSGSWDLYTINADGSGKKQITDTDDIHEMYPKVSPDGEKVCFVADRGSGRNRKRDVYMMNIDGSGRKLVSKNSRQPCWSPDGRRIAFVKAFSSRRFSMESWATKGLYIYDTATGEIKKHPNKRLEHLYSLAWSPDGKYITATVLGGMGYRHTDVAIEADGTRYFRLGIVGCRPEFSPDGKKLAWGRSDREFRIAKVNLKRRPPVRGKDKRRFIKIPKGYEIYHIDWSPDGKYAAFTYGPTAEQAVGGMAPGWNLCVAEIATGKWVKITEDGNHNKEPDWIGGGN